ncbi:MAG: hypothetical protein JRE47_14500 [Deltaproteobacteria bacterium]|nr:hypothetical protein [Deltaproteobacteria bacterium]
MEFFQQSQNQKFISEFIKKSDLIKFDNDKDQKRFDVVKRLVEYMLKNPEEWDTKCTFNITHIGDNFISYMSSVDPKNLSNLYGLYVLSFRFLCEFDFLVGAGKELNMDLKQIKSFIEKDTAKLPEDERSQLIYAAYVMPANIVKDYMNHENLSDIKEFNDRARSAQKLKEEWDSDIEKKEAVINKLKDRLKEYETAFNFVGLYQGFNQISKDKKDEIKPLFYFLIFMGLIILAPLITEFVFVIKNLESMKAYSDLWWAIALPTVSIEVILIYFFRIILFDYKSIKGQILQIELRKTLCQFIQSYAEYSNEMKDKDSSALEKFENLVFSGIVADSENIPSTFDGIDQIGRLIKVAKEK